MHSIGIDIGSYSIKIAEIEPSSHGAKLTRYNEFPLSSQPNVDDELIIIDILRNHFANYNLDEAVITVAINQSYVTHRRTFFPFKERHSIQRALPLEIEEDVPFTPENAIFDGKILSYQSKGGANVLASVTPKDRVAECIQACQDSGFEPNVISCETLAYSNLFENWMDLPPERQTLLDVTEDESEDDEGEETEKPPRVDAGALIHIGNEKTIIMVYQNKELLTCRTISWGAEELATQIHKKYQIPMSEAHKELESKGFVLLTEEGATEAQATFSSTLVEPLSILAKRLKLIFLEIESELHINISKCSLTGGVAQIQNIGPLFTQKLEVATNPLLPELQNVRNVTDNYNPFTGGVALGLAIEGIKKPRNPATNFLKGEFARGNRGFEHFKERWGRTLQFTTAAFFIFLLHSCVRSNVAEDIFFEAQGNLQSLAKKEKSIKRPSSRAIQSYIRDKKQLKAKMKDLEKIEKINSAMDILAKISKAVPSGRNIKLDIVRLLVEDEDVQVVGYLGQNDSLPALEKSLESLAMQKKLRKLNVRLAPKPGKKTFAYSFKASRIDKGF